MTTEQVTFEIRDEVWTAATRYPLDQDRSLEEYINPPKVVVKSLADREKDEREANIPALSAVLGNLPEPPNGTNGAPLEKWEAENYPEPPFGSKIHERANLVGTRDKSDGNPGPGLLAVMFPNDPTIERIWAEQERQAEQEAEFGRLGKLASHRYATPSE